MIVMMRTTGSSSKQRASRPPKPKAYRRSAARYGGADAARRRGAKRSGRNDPTPRSRGAGVRRPPVEIPRPTTRAECREEMRPCPWVACKHHLYLDINPETGSIKINFPDLEPWELQHTCALDVAERGGITLEEVGEIMNLTRERIRQVEVRGLLKLKMGSPSPDELGADLLAQAAAASSDQN